MKEEKLQEEDGTANMSNKTLEQSIRLVMEQQANAGVLYYGSDLARDTYAKDTPGQTPGVDNVVNYHKKNLQRDVFIEASSNAVFAGPLQVTSTLTIESGATVVIV